MKLCFLAAANSAHSHRWIRFFADKGHEIHWISLVPFEGPTANGIKTYELGSRLPKGIGMASATVRIRRLLAEISPDIVHAHYAGSYGVLAMVGGIRPFVLTAWGSDILFAGRSFVKGPLVRRVLQEADVITCDAHHMIDAMRALGADERKMHLIYFGVETDRFVPGPADDSIREKWMANKVPVVISLRNLEPVYRIDTLIQAVPRIVAAMPSTRIVIAGSGSQEEALRVLTSSLGVAANVNFIGRYANSDLPRMLRSADVYVSTSLSDAGIAASTAEAMACGVPVVITNTGENSRWIDDQKSGLLIAAEDPATLADRVIHLLSHPELRIQLGQAGRTVIVERNDYFREMEKMEAIYRSLATSSEAGIDRALHTRHRNV